MCVPVLPLSIVRVDAFREWLRTRPEKVIVLFGHGDFIKYLTGSWLKNGKLLEYRPPPKPPSEHPIVPPPCGRLAHTTDSTTALESQRGDAAVAVD